MGSLRRKVADLNKAPWNSKKNSRAPFFNKILRVCLRNRVPYRTGTVSIHLGNDSPMLTKHHVNWRMRAIQDLDRGKHPNQMHYSSAITVAQEDIPKVRKILLSAIDEIRDVVRESREDSLYCYCLDLFEV